MTTAERAIDVSVIIAAFNEEAILADNIRQIKASLELRPNMAWELILVNDGSQDATQAIMNAAMAEDERVSVHHHWRNFGQGRALRTGFEMSRGRVVLTWDADLSYNPITIWELYDTLNEKKVDIVLASPYAPGGQVRNVPWHRFLLSRLGNRYLASMSSYDVHTITCVVRAYRREVLDNMLLTCDGMELQLEILMKASFLNLLVAEVPAVLAWSEEKRSANKPKRVSKMRIFKTIKTYLKLGWLSKPSYMFLILGLCFLIPGVYMGGWFFYRVIQVSREKFLLGESVSQAITHGITASYVHYPQTVIVGSVLSLVGLIIWLFSLVFMQNKFYYTELYKQNQIIIKQLEKQRS